MNSSLDLSRWRERPRGIAYRRWTIIANGLRHLLRTRFFRFLLSVAWSSGLAIAAAGFTFSQSVASGGWLEAWATRLGPRAEALMAVVSGLVALFPDIVVHGVFTAIFWAHSYLGLWLSLFALTALVPQLITRDRASNALTVYLARPLTSVDYLLGKLGIITGVLLLVWTGPLLAGWLLSMLFATDRDFVVYSFSPLLRALLFNGIGLVALASIALGVSTISRSSRAATAIWVGLWIILAAMASPGRAPVLLKRASFTHSLGEVRQEVFQLDSALSDAATKLPLVDQGFATNLAKAGKNAEPTDFTGALLSLGAFAAVSSFVFFRKLRPE